MLLRKEGRGNKKIKTPLYVFVERGDERSDVGVSKKSYYIFVPLPVLIYPLFKKPQKCCF
jgi:hypothetical protein